MLKVSYLKHAEIPNLEFKNGYGNSVAIDLYTAEDVTISDFEMKLISLGISINIPDGYKIDIRMRSSTFKKYGLIETNAIGLIDTTYCGVGDIIKCPVYKLPVASLDKTITIPKGTSICQMEIIKCMENAELIELTHEEYVESINNKNDRGGFGSTDERGR